MLNLPPGRAPTRARPLDLFEVARVVADATGSLAELPAPAARAELTAYARGLRAEWIARGVPECEALDAAFGFAIAVAEELALSRLAD